MLGLEQAINLQGTLILRRMLDLSPATDLLTDLSGEVYYPLGLGLQRNAHFWHESEGQSSAEMLNQLQRSPWEMSSSLVVELLH